jgi:choline dehydrogenase-like flavoprotein
MAGKTVFRYVSSRTMRRAGHVATLDRTALWYHSLSHGGLSNFWTGAVPRFAPEDFSDGSRLDERYRWPLSYEELEPYYAVAESVLSITAGRRSLRTLPANSARYEASLPPDWAAAAAVLDPADSAFVPLPMAKGSPWMAAARGTEFNSFTALVRPLRHNGSFHLIPGAHVTSLSWRSTTSRVDAVQYLDRCSRAPRTLRVDAVVVAAGALNSTRILMASRSRDFPRGIGGNEGVLGRYLHDHTREWWRFTTDRPLTLPFHPVYLPRADYDTSRPLMAASCTIGLASARDRVRTLVNGAGRAFGVTIFGTMVPNAEHTLTLSKHARDEIDQPMLELAIEYDELAMRTVADARSRLADVFQTIGNPIHVRSRPPTLHPPGSSVHYAGTARMHDKRVFGVLDGWNRVHDAPNVVVCDASCFTTSPEKNPTLTAMALAARASDRLADDLGV